MKNKFLVFSLVVHFSLILLSTSSSAYLYSDGFYCYTPTYQDYPYYPIGVVDSGNMWFGNIAPGSSTASIYDNKGEYLGDYAISQKESSYGCSPGWSLFKLNILGDDGNTWVLLEATNSSGSNFVNSVLWKGTIYKRTSPNQSLSW